VVGNRTRVKVVKNKVAPPFREAQFDILYNEGISRIGDLIDVAVEHNVIAKSGSWFSYKEERIGQGRDAVKAYLKENPNTAREIDSEMRKRLGLVSSSAAQPTNGNTPAVQTKAAPATKPAAPVSPAPAKPIAATKKP
jgi:recombination protein RecA